MSNPAHLIPRGPEDTILPAEPAAAVQALEKAMEAPEADRYLAIQKILEEWPAFLGAWAHLGECAPNTISAYAAYRVGYHRGLDKLRGSGWKGSGMVRWEHPENRGFLLALYGLQKTAELIGELEEKERCEHFLHQLDPEWPPAQLSNS